MPEQNGVVPQLITLAEQCEARSNAADPRDAAKCIMWHEIAQAIRYAASRVEVIVGDYVITKHGG
ncbi:MAG: hypothetical protein J2P48_08345 [Alphaproteobacteria bacterium]|nr:hypothetical protein [Alphaproteobacteria bacterium]